ncbi:Inducer of phenazine A [Streptomyces sp. NPDC059894]|uniref:Inducer of phenazine A n=1 Tax=unclassified Streptomyces TaxID=2593676 RepID=UPI003657D607
MGLKLHREVLTPQMMQYDDFDDRGSTHYLPYLMFANKTNYTSDVLNTDRYGFRFSHGPDGLRASPDSDIAKGPVRLFAGSSAAFGVGATSDAATIPSYLWSRYAPSTPWLNFGGRSFNSTQEVVQMLLFRHLVPEIEEIVLFSGLNNLLLSRLPAWQQGDHGAFFYCNEYYDLMDELRARHRKAGRRLWSRDRAQDGPERAEREPLPPMPELIARSAELAARHLQGWRQLTAGTGTRITYVLSPVATWVRDEPSEQEALIFKELDKLAALGVSLEELFGDGTKAATGRSYAEALRAECDKQDVRFIDLSPELAKVTTSEDWLFVDRGHFTDHGHDVIAELLAGMLSLR